MLTILFLSLNVALLQGIPVAQVSQVSQGKDRCGYNIETTTTQKPKLTTLPSFRLDPFECTVPEYFDPLGKYVQHLAIYYSKVSKVRVNLYLSFRI